VRPAPPIGRMRPRVHARSPRYAAGPPGSAPALAHDRRRYSSARSAPVAPFRAPRSGPATARAHGSLCMRAWRRASPAKPGLCPPWRGWGWVPGCPQVPSLTTVEPVAGPATHCTRRRTPSRRRVPRRRSTVLRPRRGNGGRDSPAARCRGTPAAWTRAAPRIRCRGRWWARRAPAHWPAARTGGRAAGGCARHPTASSPAIRPAAVGTGSPRDNRLRAGARRRHRSSPTSGTPSRRHSARDRAALGAGRSRPPAGWSRAVRIRSPAPVCRGSV
jgi:hypothetical protein